MFQLKSVDVVSVNMLFMTMNMNEYVLDMNQRPKAVKEFNEVLVLAVSQCSIYHKLVTMMSTYSR